MGGFTLYRGRKEVKQGEKIKMKLNYYRFLSFVLNVKVCILGYNHCRYL